MERTVRSHVEGRWHESDAEFAVLHNPCTEEPIARASSHGIDFAAALEYARTRGGAALRELTIGQRGALLLALSKCLQERRDELIAVSLENTGATRKDAKFDVDGGMFTLAYYGKLGQDLGDRRVFVDGEGLQLGRSPRFWGQHVCVPLQGAAVHVNAFNFPVWGLAEKAACALLAGMPVISKPATSTCLVTEQAVAAVVEAGILPDGALSLICGSTGDLLDLLGSQDVLAFTGSASTALGLRSKPNLLAASTRVNVEADSLNAAVLGPDLAPGSESWSVALQDIQREMTQKTGQKCTAVRRVLVSRERIEAVQRELGERLGQTVVGNPAEASVTMGPLATARQLDDAVSGTARLGQAAAPVVGPGTRVDGRGAEPGRGYFFEPTLLRAEDAYAAAVVHQHEVFGPVATLLPYDGSAAEAAAVVGLSEGSLVTSIYSDDREFLGQYLRHGGASTGRLYIGSEKVAPQLPGSGVAMPMLLHGGPGRAGGGEELGGERGLQLYLQRLAVTGDRAVVDLLAGTRR